MSHANEAGDPKRLYCTGASGIIRLNQYRLEDGFQESARRRSRRNKGADAVCPRRSQAQGLETRQHSGEHRTEEAIAKARIFQVRYRGTGARFGVSSKKKRGSLRSASDQGGAMCWF